MPQVGDMHLDVMWWKHAVNKHVNNSTLVVIVVVFGISKKLRQLYDRTLIVAEKLRTSLHILSLTFFFFFRSLHLSPEGIFVSTLIFVQLA